MTSGTLILCSGPIGNLGDAPPRLAEALASASVVFAEDTRRARTLLEHLGVDRPLRSYFVGNEHERSEELRERFAAGETVALLTDAGTPSIADPGLTAVRVAEAAGATVTAVPGPSAVTMALTVSGFGGDRFVFEGFLPRSGAERRDRITAIGRETRTTVLFCSPRRLGADLTELADACGDRDVVVCRELTKFHEEIWRGSLCDAAVHWSASPVKGEVTVVVGGGAEAVVSLDDALDLVRSEVASGSSVSSAVRSVAEGTGVRRKALYERALREL